MKSNESLQRAQKHDLEERRQRVRDIETMIDELKRMASDLDQQIRIDEERSGVSDINHYAYPTFAKAAVQRRDNLLESVGDLEVRLADAHKELETALEESKALEISESGGRETHRPNRRRGFGFSNQRRPGRRTS